EGLAPNPVWRNYRAACEWILASPRFGSGATVMVREHGVAAFLHKDTIAMPVGSLERTICFANANRAHAIIGGPAERLHNRNIEMAAGLVEPQKAFGEGADRVAVLALNRAFSPP